VKFLSPIVTAGFPVPGLPLGVDALVLLLLLLLLPHAATTTASATAIATATPCFALLCTYPPLFRFI
jgi:hypothetical protein